MGQGAASAQVRLWRSLLPLAASPAPFLLEECFWVYLNVGVYQFMGRRLPC